MAEYTNRGYGQNVGFVHSLFICINICYYPCQVQSTTQHQIVPAYCGKLVRMTPNTIKKPPTPRQYRAYLLTLIGWFLIEPTSFALGCLGSFSASKSLFLRIWNRQPVNRCPEPTIKTDPKTIRNNPTKKSRLPSTISGIRKRISKKLMITTTIIEDQTGDFLTKSTINSLHHEIDCWTAD